MISALRDLGVRWLESAPKHLNDGPLADAVVVLTGTLTEITREQAGKYLRHAWRNCDEQRVEAHHYFNLWCKRWS